jgi:hypothetical protein
MASPARNWPKRLFDDPLLPAIKARLPALSTVYTAAVLPLGVPPSATYRVLPTNSQEMPYLQSLYAKQRGQGLVFLGVNVLDDREITRKFLRERGLTLPNIVAASPPAETVSSRHYVVGTIPLNYFINRHNIIVDRWIGYQDGRARGSSARKTLGLAWAGSQP